MEHFESLFSDPNRNENDQNEELQIEEPNDEIENLIFNSEITEDEVLVAVKHLKRGQSAGPDDLLPEFLIECIEILLPILTHLFNRLFKYGIWKSVPVCLLLINTQSTQYDVTCRASLIVYTTNGGKNRQSSACQKNNRHKYIQVSRCTRCTSRRCIAN